MHRKIISLLLIVIFMIVSFFVMDGKNPGNASWVFLLVSPMIYYMCFGIICSFVLRIRFRIKMDLHLFIFVLILLYLMLIPIIYYSPISIIGGVESFFMLNRTAASMLKLIAILFGLIAGGFIRGWIKGSSTEASVQDIR